MARCGIDELTRIREHRSSEEFDIEIMYEDAEKIGKVQDAVAYIDGYSS